MDLSCNGKAFVIEMRDREEYSKRVTDVRRKAVNGQKRRQISSQERSQQRRVRKQLCAEIQRRSERWRSTEGGQVFRVESIATGNRTVRRVVETAAVAKEAG
jgi:hypothetical protein